MRKEFPNFKCIDS